jgi:hypothetical protein
MVNGNNVYIPESMFDGGNGYFKGTNCGLWLRHQL